MTGPTDSAAAPRTDVVICGGGLAGLLLARQLHLELPQLSVTVLEQSRRPLPDACHKVGESSVETGSQYLERLGLEDYLLDQHLIKLGLRFFPGHGELPLHLRTEIGPGAEPVVRSYQIDRGRFETAMRGFIEDDGSTLIEGARVRDIALGAGDDDHVITYELDGESQTINAHWVVDASGRAALLRSKLKLKRGAKHVASSGWFRIKGRFDINSMVPESETSWHGRACADERWRSTNHFMGKGYWAWVIPLSTGYTSIGLVVHEDTHAFSNVRSLENVRAFLAEHEPHLAAALEPYPAEDFLCLGKYTNGISRSFSVDRWAIVGEAGAFVDPLYSPGTDFIGFANCFATEMIRVEQQGGDLEATAQLLNTQFRILVTGTTDVFLDAAPVYGHVQAMSAKIYWDNFVYWSYTGQYFQQNVWQMDADNQGRINAAGRLFGECSAAMQALFRAWAVLEPSVAHPIMMGLPTFPSVLVDAHIAMGQKMEAAEAVAYIEQRANQGREMVTEFVVRVIQLVSPDTARAILGQARYDSWGMAVPPERLDMEALDSLSRRKAISPIAKDIERYLGRQRRHPDAALCRELLAQRTTA